MFKLIAVPLIDKYEDECWSRVLKTCAKRREQIPQEIKTDVFLSHRQATAQGMALSLQRELKASMSVFLDVQTEFDLHDLNKLVLNTRLFVFILSEGIFQSDWCYEGSFVL